MPESSDKNHAADYLRRVLYRASNVMQYVSSGLIVADVMLIATDVSEQWPAHAEKVNLREWSAMFIGSALVAANTKPHR